MDHRRGKDPTPGGRQPTDRTRAPAPATARDVQPQYENSAPGPEQMADGAAFFGYKRENTYPANPAKQP